MDNTPQPDDVQQPETEAFRREAEQPPLGLVREFLAFLVENKKWWLAPIVLVLLLLGLLVVLANTGVAPFIYTF